MPLLGKKSICYNKFCKIKNFSFANKEPTKNLISLLLQKNTPKYKNLFSLNPQILGSYTRVFTVCHADEA